MQAIETLSVFFISAFFFFLGFAIFIYMLDKALKKRDDRLRTAYLKELGNELISISYWFSEVPDVQSAINLIGEAYAHDGFVDFMEVRVQWLNNKSEADNG